MSKWLRNALMGLLGFAGVVATGAFCAFASAVAYVWVTQLIWPLEADEAAGPQFAQGVIVIFTIIPLGFVAGCAIAIHLWNKLDDACSDPRGVH